MKRHTPAPKHTLSRRKFVSSSMGAITVALGAPSIARAQSTELKISNWLPRDNVIVTDIIDILRQEVEVATNGRVRMTYLDEALGAPPDHFDLLASGEADIAVSVHGYSGPEKFLRAQIGQFSFLGDAYSASQAFSRVYSQLLDAEEEHAGIKLLGLFQQGPGVIMMRDREINDPSDFAGLTLRTSGGYISGLLQDLGVDTVAMHPGKVAAALADSSIDGVAFPIEGAIAFNLFDQVNYVSTVPGGYYNTSWFLGMSERASSQMSTADFATVQKIASDLVPVLSAKAFDYGDYLATEEFNRRGIPMVDVNTPTLNRITEIATGYEAQWSAALAETGYDGTKALSYTRRLTGG